MGWNKGFKFESEIWRSIWQKEDGSIDTPLELWGPHTKKGKKEEGKDEEEGCGVVGAIELMGEPMALECGQERERGQ